MSLALCLALALAPPNQDGGRVAPATPPTFHGATIGLFDALLPECKRLQRSGITLIGLDENKAFAIDAQDAKADWSPHRSGELSLIDAVPFARGWARLLCRESDSSVLHLEVDWPETPQGWEPDLRCDLAERYDYVAPLLAADKGVLVVLDGNGLHRFEEGAWHSTTVMIDEAPFDDLAEHVLLDDRTLYIGTNKGEWGGNLFAIDITSGQGRVVSKAWTHEGDDVTDIDRGPDGRIWVTFGCEHGSWITGALYVGENSDWRLVAESAPPSRAPTDERASQIPTTAFAALDFDEKGRAILLCGSRGLYRQETDGSWSWLTLGWPEWGAWVEDLAIVGKRAVIASGVQGAIVVDLDTLEARRVHIKS